VLTFHLVCFGWILFRSPSLRVMERILDGFTSGLPFALDARRQHGADPLPVAVLLHTTGTGTGARTWFVRLPPWVQGAAYAGVVALVFCFSPATEGFIYFQF
jgi:hypothetical protein